MDCLRTWVSECSSERYFLLTVLHASYVSRMESTAFTFKESPIKVAREDLLSRALGNLEIHSMKTSNIFFVHVITFVNIVAK